MLLLRTPFLAVLAITLLPVRPPRVALVAAATALVLILTLARRVAVAALVPVAGTVAVAAIAMASAAVPIAPAEVLARATVFAMLFRHTLLLAGAEQHPPQAHKEPGTRGCLLGAEDGCRGGGGQAFHSRLLRRFAAALGTGQGRGFRRRHQLVAEIGGTWLA